MIPMGLLKGPKCHGPLRNLSPTKKVLMKIGIVKAMKAANAATLKIAPMAMLPANIRQRRRHPMVVLNQTALTGVRVVLLTRLIHHEAGKHSSLAYANVTCKR